MESTDTNQKTNTNQSQSQNSTQRQGQDYKKSFQRPRKPQKNDRKADSDEFISSTVLTRRTAKVVKGGKKMRFSALVVVGNRKGRIGYAMGKGADPKSAIEKATKKAKKLTFMIPVVNDTIPHEVMYKLGAARLFLKPAPEGTGIIASSVIRAVVESAGIKNVYSKLYGTNNKISNVQCAMDALKSLKVKFKEEK